MLDSIMTLGCGCILYLQNKKLFIITILVVALNAIVALFYRKPVNKSNRQIMEKNDAVQSYLKESIDGIYTVKATTSEKEIQYNTYVKMGDYIGALVNNSKIVAFQEILANYIENIGKLIILWMGFSFVLTGEISVGELLTYYALLAYFTEPIKKHCRNPANNTKAFLAFDRLIDIFELEIDSMEDGMHVPEINEWKMSHVNFCYAYNKFALTDISFSIHRGEKVAIVGESGCGKSTLAKLLLRYYEPKQGEIMVNNVPISELNLRELRKSIAFVSQETFLFSDSIYANLCIGLDQVPKEYVKNACVKSEIDEYINKLPLKYNTPIEENGVNLSGGQKTTFRNCQSFVAFSTTFYF